MGESGQSSTENRQLDVGSLSGDEGLSLPVLPDTIIRDDSGRVTVRAVRLVKPFLVDGKLDDEVYSRVRPMSDFIQTDPVAGELATEQTDVWIFFDDDNIYFSARCWETQPDRIVANELRRDHRNIVQNDNIAFLFDTFYDRRSGVVFETTPLGARLDVQFATENQNNYDWNPIWQVKVEQFDQGWTVEAEIPFKSLRFKSGQEQTWGFNVRRSSRWKNELSFLSEVPNSVGMGGIFRPTLAATMVGLEVPNKSKTLEIKPYVISELVTDRLVSPEITNKFSGDVGLDVKYGLTQSLIADFTYNTDFAQVEVDSQQVNLTRFSLFFPEKREFFLENKGIFAFGGNRGSPWGNGGDTPILFYSRRIGLNNGLEVPIKAGGRLTGRIGRFTLGALNIHSGENLASESPGTNFTVLRLRRDVLRKSSIGLIFTGRSAAQTSNGSNLAYGVDGRFAFFEDLTINTFWASTRTRNLKGDNFSYRAKFDYDADRYGLTVEHLAVGDNFNPEIGFVRRDDLRRSFAEVRFSPRPSKSTVVRKYSFVGSVDYNQDGDGLLETRELNAEFRVDFQNSDAARIEYADSYEFLQQPFAIASGTVLPVGGYNFSRLHFGYSFGRQRDFSGIVFMEIGSFYTGKRTTLTIMSGLANITSRFSIEPSLSLNWVALNEGSFVAKLAGGRFTYTMTTMMFASAFFQYNSSNNTLSSNIRLRWEYHPGSELFVVYNEERDPLRQRFSGLSNRSFVVKFNRLIRF